MVISACGGGSGSSSSGGGTAQLTLTANPATIASGQSSTIAWQALNSVSCRALEDWTSSTSLSGNVTVGPLTNTVTYTMECLGKEGGPITESVSISIEEQQPNQNNPATPGPVTPATPGPVTPATPGPVTPATPGPVTPATPGPVTPVTPAAPDPTPPTLGSTELAWEAPTTSADGSVLSDLSGYTIYYGTNQNNLNQIININTAGVTTYVINNLQADTYYFSITAKDNSNNESARSNIASKVIR